MIDILILALFAVFILSRLYKVLGSKPENEKDLSSKDPSSEKNHAVFKKKMKDVFGESSIIDVPFEKTEKDVKGGQNVLEDLKKIDPHFDVQHFLSGAKVAFRTILTAFFKGDEKTLKPLLCAEIFVLFAKDIQERSTTQCSLEIKDLHAEILHARLDKKMIQIDVQLESEQIHTLTTPTSDAGHPPCVSQEIQTCIDIWTFEKPLQSHNPNWLLSSTQEGTLSL